MLKGLCITVRNQHGDVVEYHTAVPVLHIDVPEGRYVITLTAEDAPSAEGPPIIGRLQ